MTAMRPTPIHPAAFVERGISPTIITARRIQETVAEFYGITTEEMIGPRRPRHIAVARQVAMCLMRTFTRLSLDAIGESFSRDHGTVIWALRSINGLRQTEPNFASEYIAVEQRVHALIGEKTSASRI